MKGEEIVAESTLGLMPWQSACQVQALTKTSRSAIVQEVNRRPIKNAIMITINA
jgi:hypothetical protein